MDPRDVPGDILEQWEVVVQHVVAALPYLHDAGITPEVLVGWPPALRLPGLTTLQIVQIREEYWVALDHPKATITIALADRDVVAIVLEEIGLLVRRRYRGTHADRRAQEAEMVDMLRGTGWQPDQALPGGGIGFDGVGGHATGHLQRTEAGRDPGAAVFAIDVRVTNLTYHAALEALAGIGRVIRRQNVTGPVDFGGAEDGCPALRAL
jgi:hypothetical protein